MTRLEALQAVERIAYFMRLAVAFEGVGMTEDAERNEAWAREQMVALGRRLAA